MNNKINYSLAMLINLGIYGVAQPAFAADQAAPATAQAAAPSNDDSLTHEDTLVVTAAEQNLQAPGVSTITAEELKSAHRRVIFPKSFVLCRALT
ncbi:hypothetical protein ACSPAB_05130 [Buttiauxella agrestis]